MEVRVLEERDIPRIKEIIKEGYPYLGLNGTYVYWLTATLYQGYSFVAEENGKVCGFVTALPNPEKKAVFVWQLGVATEMRRKNAAYEMLKSVWKKAEESGFPGIITSINKENQASQNSFFKVAREFQLSKEVIGKFEADGFSEDVYMFRKN